MTSLPEDYGSLPLEVKERIRAGQYQALRAVNKELIGLYRDIGRMIARRQEYEGWGKSVVKQLSDDLQQEFPGIKGFSVQNLWYMRQFYQKYHDSEKLQPLVGEIKGEEPHHRRVRPAALHTTHRRRHIPDGQGTAPGTQRGTPGHEGDREVAGGWGMKEVCSRMDTPARSAARPCREFVQRCIARIPWRGDIVLLSKMKDPNCWEKGIARDWFDKAVRLATRSRENCDGVRV